jgi:hypothetical protein
LHSMETPIHSNCLGSRMKQRRVHDHVPAVLQCHRRCANCKNICLSKAANAYERKATSGMGTPPSYSNCMNQSSSRAYSRFVWKPSISDRLHGQFAYKGLVAAKRLWDL